MPMQNELETFEAWTKFLTSFHLFCRDCLGFKDMIYEHEQLCNFIQFDGHKTKLILMPRYSFKSTIATIGYSLWKMIQDPNIRILIYSDSALKAKGFLDGIKNHILEDGGSSNFRKYFPGWESGVKEGKWNDSQIIISQRTSADHVPTVDTSGIESSKVGMHYDLIIFDDIVTDQNISTKAQMDKTYDCYKKSLSLLKPKGEVILVGTRWHFYDAYGRILHDLKNKIGIFIKRASMSDNGKPYPFSKIGLTEEFLDEQKSRQGNFIWSCLYEQNPIDDKTAIFRKENFRFYGPSTSENDLYITCTCDPAGVGEDFTAFTVVGTDEDYNIFILECINDHLTTDQIISEIIRLSYRYHFKVFGIESNFFSGALDKQLKLALEDERKNKSFTPFSIEQFRASAKVGTGKYARIMSIQPYHQRGSIIFPGYSIENLKGAMGELAYQMIQCTQSHQPSHDDLIDALAYQISLIRRGYAPVHKKPEEMTIARIIEDERLRFNSNQSRVPRRYREFLQPVF